MFFLTPGGPLWLHLNNQLHTQERCCICVAMGTPRLPRASIRLSRRRPVVPVRFALIWNDKAPPSRDGEASCKSGRPDLNRGPPAPKAGAIPGYATPRGGCEKNIT